MILADTLHQILEANLVRLGQLDRLAGVRTLVDLERMAAELDVGLADLLRLPTP